MSYGVLALDLATTTGWAFYADGMERPFFGAEPLSGGVNDIGRRCEHLRQFIGDQHRMHALTDLVWEWQHVAMRRTKNGKSAPTINIETLTMLFALGGMAEWMAYRLGIRAYKVVIGEWRREFLGRGSGFKAAGLPDAGEMSIRRCAELGWYTNSHDAAEACGILDFHLSLIEQADATFRRPWRDDTFMGGIHRQA